MSTRRCSVCGRMFSSDQFYSDKSKSDGLDNRCKECRKIYQYRVSNEDKYNDILKSATRRLQYLKTSVGLEFNLYGKKKHGSHRDLCNFTCPKCKGNFKRKSVIGLSKRNGLCINCFGETNDKLFYNDNDLRSHECKDSIRELKSFSKEKTTKSSSEEKFINNFGCNTKPIRVIMIPMYVESKKEPKMGNRLLNCIKGLFSK